MQERDWLYVSARNFVILIVTAALVLPNSAHAEPLSIRGSDTLIYLGQRFAALYSRRSPDTQIIVQGGSAQTGSAQAVKALSAEETDIAQFEGAPLSRASLDIVSFPVGVQAIVVYVNESNPVRELTIGQLRSIFMGEITNWKALGGPDTNISLYAGESSTGTLTYFQEVVLHADPYPFVGKSNTKALLDEISSHPEAIGYGSLASAQGVRAVNIKLSPTSLAVAPTGDTIRSRQYPITRYISWALRRQHSPALDALCRWVLSPEGQLLVEGVGFEPLLPNERSAALEKLQESGKSKESVSHLRGLGK